MTQKKTTWPWHSTPSTAKPPQTTHTTTIFPWSPLQHDHKPQLTHGVLQHDHKPQLTHGVLLQHDHKPQHIQGKTQHQLQLPHQREDSKMSSKLNP